MILSKFGNEVLSRGATAVLPQNLDARWLAHLQQLADDFIDTHFVGGDCKQEGFRADPVLMACVSEILRHQKGRQAEISEEELFEKVTIYSLAVTMESVGRQDRFALRPPSLDNIFDRERLRELRRVKPDLGPVLKAICLERK